MWRGPRLNLAGRSVGWEALQGGQDSLGLGVALPVTRPRTLQSVLRCDWKYSQKTLEGLLQQQEIALSSIPPSFVSPFSNLVGKGFFFFFFLIKNSPAPQFHVTLYYPL